MAGSAPPLPGRRSRLERPRSSPAPPSSTPTIMRRRSPRCATRPTADREGAPMPPTRADHIEAAADAEAVAHKAAAWIAGLAAQSRGEFALCLSGGSTPRRLYQLLGGRPYADRMPWDRVHWFWGDERFVPWDHPDSNYRMARTALLAEAPIPPENIHGIVTKGSSAAAARSYERELKSFHGAETLDPERPLFDV